MSEPTVMYFAYGSCMGARDFRRTVPEFQRLGKAMLPDFRVGFTLDAEARRGGVADIVPEPGEVMEGVLFEFPEKYLPLLDEREGTHIGHYRRREVILLHEGKAVTAWTYEVVDKAAEEIAPSVLYRDLLMEARDVLSHEYMEKLWAHMEKLRADQGKTE
ncbi:MAG TPA: gamma-glutamylcyclotransferase family protein [Bacilli bacterium]|nr:gamma-glutamylcyclotransferase family protein [Bacilli bacterium]